MKKTFWIALLLLAVGVLPAVAETFTVQLKNGNSMITRYQPQRASWDPQVVLILGDSGNWIALREADIQKVTSSLETRGFGLRIDSRTLFLGWSANDGTTAAGEADEEAPTPRSYDIQQFVEPGRAGQGGFPVYGTGYEFSGSSGGTGGGGGTSPAPAPAPTPSPAPSTTPPAGAAQ
ncbi:MAG TPA: hypothetical protein PK413_00650 [Thermoanaerobaculia bacterium]|nr:hypothetical protein [Thermoanaerobaculia bacterium]